MECYPTAPKSTEVFIQGVLTLTLTLTLTLIGGLH